MSSPNTQTRKVVLHLTMEQARFLDQERTRLRDLVGKSFTANEILQLLVEQHQQKMRLRAIGDPESVAWMYRKLAGGE